MSFNPAVPLSTDSPGVFPAQNQTNMTRLQTLVGADHQFNLSAAANDGWHNLIHLIPQTPSGALAGTGRFYSKDVSGSIQAFYMDQAGTEYQLTPTTSLGPTKITGHAVLNPATSQLVFNGAGSDNYAGFGVVYRVSTTTSRTVSFFRSFAISNVDQLATHGGSAAPTIAIVGGSLFVVASPSAGAAHDYYWSIILNTI